MIISKTPYRISFAGGLSDLENYYKHKGGQVVSTTIDKYIYIFITKSYSGKYRAVYSEVEEVDNIDDIKHPLIRECMRYVGGTYQPIEIVSLADTVGGSGLGSSSAYTVGLLNALYGYKGVSVTKAKLAEDACKIEIDILGEPIGKQDQYAVAFGGLNRLFFNRKGVRITPINMDMGYYEKLQDNLMLFHTGITRRAGDVLSSQKKNFKEIFDTVTDLSWLANCVYDDLLKGNVDKVGYYLDEVWELKKTTGKVTTPEIEEILLFAKSMGATGGKICGAGSGGFVMLYCDKAKQYKVRNTLMDYRELPFKFEEYGSRIIYDG